MNLASACHRQNIGRIVRPLARSRALAHQRHNSKIGKPLSTSEIEELLSKPTWSVRSLTDHDQHTPPAEVISEKQLHHLLRLSALPLPESPEQQASMIETLQSQLHFVRAIQSVDTTGVEPLSAIKDETNEARSANEFTLESLKDELDKEELVGFARRIRRKAGSVVGSGSEEASIDVMKLAPNKIGRYVIVNTKKS